MDNVNSNVTSNVTGNITGNFTDNAVPASVKNMLRTILVKTHCRQNEVLTRTNLCSLKNTKRLFLVLPSKPLLQLLLVGG